MTDFYDRLAATAIRLLRRRGAPVTLPRETSGSGPDPVTGATTAGVDATKTTTGILLPYRESQIDGTRIKAGDRMLVLTNEVEPLQTDTPKMGGEVLGSVVSIKTVAPAGSAVVHFMQVRK